MVETSQGGKFHNKRVDFKLWVPAFLLTHKTLFTMRGFLSVFVWLGNLVGVLDIPRLRPVAFNLTDFGAVGDGVTLNTKAFERAILAISKLAKRGRGQLT